MMRIITGTAKGIRLSAPSGLSTRPTSERAKEAVFSMLQFELENCRVLDLFGGSGQLGLEAVSRGAAHSVIVDADREAAECIRANAIRTRLADRVTVCRSDALVFLENYAGPPFDLVFLDPPYALGLVPLCLERLLRRGMLASGSVTVCETRNEADVFGKNSDLSAQFLVLRQSKYGVAGVCLLTPRELDT